MIKIFNNVILCKIKFLFILFIVLEVSFAGIVVKKNLIKKPVIVNNQEDVLSLNSINFLTDQIIIPAWYEPFGIEVTDVNDDGYKDLFVVDCCYNTLRIFIWNPDIGYWDISVKKDDYIGSKLAVDDVNNDGMKDILTYSYPDYISIFLWNNNTSDWDNQVIINTEEDTGGGFFGVADTNNNGINEIVVQGSNRLYIYHYEGMGYWVMETISPAYWGVIIGDVNNDGLNEIVTAPNNGNSELYIFSWNEPLHQWDITIKTFNYVNTMKPTKLSLGDANNDGYDDLVFIDHYPDPSIGILIWNQSKNDWNNEPVHIFTEWGYRVETGDINNDGYNDIITDYYSEYRIFCWNNSLKNWNPPLWGRLLKDGHSHDLVVDDINNDGLIDFAMGNSRINGISLFLGYYSLDSPILSPLSPSINYNNNSVSLNWSAVEGAKEYLIYRDTEFITSINNIDPIARVSKNNYTDYVPINGKYHYAIVAGDYFIKSLPSNCEDIIIAKDLTTNYLSSGIHEFRFFLKTSTYQLNVSISISVYIDVILFFSWYTEYPFNNKLSNIIMFIDLITNDTNSINEVNFSIIYDYFVNIEFWALDFDYTYERDEWEWIPANETSKGFFFVTFNHLSVFAITGIEKKNDLIFIIVSVTLGISTVVLSGIILLLRKKNKK